MLREVGNKDSDEDQTMAFRICLAIYSWRYVRKNRSYMDNAKFQELADARSAQWGVKLSFMFWVMKGQDEMHYSIQYPD